MTRWARDHELTSNQEGRVDARYMAEVEQMTRARVARYERAEAALLAAEKRRARAAQLVADARSGRERSSARRAAARADELLEERRRELEALSRLMSSAPASAQHRGTRSHRPVPVRHGGPL